MTDYSISRRNALNAMCDNCDAMQPSTGVCTHFPCTRYIAVRELKATQPEIIRCKDCKHRPIATRADEGILWGFSVEFPDERCPCQCEDGWYSYYPKDDFYCANAERRTENADFVRASNNSDFAQAPTWNDAVSLVGSMPSAQRKSKWVERGIRKERVCGECGGFAPWLGSVNGIEFLTPYCPWCGAEMRGEQDG